jgi:hypothetical protein
MLEGDYSSSESDDKQPSAASHVDLEQVVKAISDLVGADYSAKYSVSSFIEYNTEEYVPSSSMKETKQTRSDKKHFDRSKGYGGKRFSQAVFGFEKSIIPSAKLRKGGSRVNSPLFPLFAITTGWAGKDERTCKVRFWHVDASGLMKPPGVLKSLVENLKEDNGKAIPLDHEDKRGFSEPIKFLAGLVKAQGGCGFHGSCRGQSRRRSRCRESPGGESPGGGDRWAPAPDEATAEAAGGQHVLG